MKSNDNYIKASGKILASTAMAWVLIAQMPVYAEEEKSSKSDLVLDEITVTATRSVENLQNVGIAVSAFKGETLENRGIVDTGDLGQITPGLIVAKAGGSELTGLVSIRGVSQNDFTAHLESPNAFYIDGVYQASASNGIQQFYDVERIEVLKGPQGTLFGRNATGGLLNVFTRDPGDEFEGYLSAGAASYNEMTIKGGVTIPISDKVTSRIAFLRTRHDGYYKNLNPDGVDLNGDNTSAVRVKLNITPNDRLTVKLSGDYYHTDYIGTGGMFAVPAAPDPITGLGVNLPIDTPFVLGGGSALSPFETTANFAGGYSRETWGLSANINYDFDEISFSGITSYGRVRSSYAEDNDQTSANVATFHQEPFNINFSQELRLHKDSGQLRWNVGLYYLNVKGDYFNRFNFIAADADLNVNYNIDAKSYSAFAQASYDIGDKLTVTAGARLVYDEKNYFQEFECIAANPGTSACPGFGAPGTIGGASPLTNEHSETGWTGRLQLDYQANDDLLLYASLNRGYKSFNYNGNFAGNVPLSGLILTGEVLVAKEIGVKYKFWEGRGRVNASAFHYNYANYHAFDQRSLNFTLFNADSKIYGGEIDMALKLGEGFTTTLAVNLLQSKVFDVPIQGLGNVTRQAAQSPHYSIVASVEKSVETKIGQVTAIVNGVYYGKQFAQISNAPNTLLEAYGNVNVRINIAPTDNIDMSLFVKNLFNNQKPNYAFDLAVAGYTELDLANPRIFGVELKYTF